MIDQAHGSVEHVAVADHVNDHVHVHDARWSN